MSLLYSYLVSGVLTGLTSIMAIHEAAPPKPQVPVPAVHFVQLDSDGESKVVTVQKIDRESITTMDLDGRRRTEPLSKLIMLSRAAVQPPQLPRYSPISAENPGQLPLGVLHTVDGQIIAGSLGESKGKADALVWRSPVAGVLEVPLEQLRKLDCVYPPSTMNAHAKFAKDTLMLRNGDVMSGFVDSIGEEVSIETGTAAGKQMVTVPLNRIETVFLAQGRVSPRGTVVSTRSGLVLEFQAVQLQDRRLSGRVALAGPGTQLTLDDSEIETIVLDASRAAPLALSTFYNIVDTSGRGWSQPLEFRGLDQGGYAAELELPGPMQVDCDLPSGASRFLFHAQLPHSCRTWGDPVFVISAGDGKTFKELKRIRLSGDTPEAHGNIVLAGAKVLRLCVEAGAGGAIQDKVSLKRAIVLIEPATSGAARPGNSQ